MKNCIIIMGVSGSGKSTVGIKLAKKLGWQFFDADDFHPEANIQKMSAGHPLNDDDRAPWLDRLRNLIDMNAQTHTPIILACSALKKTYRDKLRTGDPELLFVYLQGSFDLIWERMAERKNHYMKAEMLHSQFEALEEPQNALIIPIEQPIDIIVDTIEAELASSA